MNHDNVILMLEAFGASGIASIIVGLLTVIYSGGKQKNAEPNGARTRLQDEVLWLRQQLTIAQMNGYKVIVEKPKDDEG